MIEELGKVGPKAAQSIPQAASHASSVGPTTGARGPDADDARFDEQRREVHAQIQEQHKELEPLELELAQLRTKMCVVWVWI